MPTKRSQGMLGLIRSHKRFATTVSKEVMQIDPPAHTVARMQMHGTKAAVLSDLGMPGLMVYPHTRLVSQAAILHLHGGAYVSGGLMQCRALISPIGARAGIPALTIS